MSDKPSWTERTGLTAGWSKQLAVPAAPPPLAATSPEQPVADDEKSVDPFINHRDYKAVRTILGRSQDACFLADDGLPYIKPWAYFLGAEAHPAHRGITLHWPGVRVEVKGENLREVYLRVMTRHADVWRVFDAATHDPPMAETPIIKSIRLVIEAGA